MKYLITVLILSACATPQPKPETNHRDGPSVSQVRQTVKVEKFTLVGNSMSRGVDEKGRQFTKFNEPLK